MVLFTRNLYNLSATCPYPESLESCPQIDNKTVKIQQEFAKNNNVVKKSVIPIHDQQYTFLSVTTLPTNKTATKWVALWHKIRSDRHFIHVTSNKLLQRSNHHIYGFPPKRGRNLQVNITLTAHDQSEKVWKIISFFLSIITFAFLSPTSSSPLFLAQPFFMCYSSSSILATVCWVSSSVTGIRWLISTQPDLLTVEVRGLSACCIVQIHPSEHFKQAYF